MLYIKISLHVLIKNNKKFNNESSLGAFSSKIVPDPDKLHAIKKRRSEQETYFYISLEGAVSACVDRTIPFTLVITL